MLRSWFKPKCPVEPNAKLWIERRLAWLCDQFGKDVLLKSTMVCPLQEFFPDPYNGSEESNLKLLSRVCGYMRVDPARIEWQFVDDSNKLWLVNDLGQWMPQAAGVYQRQNERGVIQLATSQLDNPMHLVGTAAHELSHERLLGEGRVNDEQFDHELLTDLNVVFHGLGIFLANVPRAWESDFGLWPGTEVRRPNYMSLPMYGYALAHMAWLRGETKPAWARNLRLDARAPFNEGLRYLNETADTTFAMGR